MSRFSFICCAAVLFAGMGSADAQFNYVRTDQQICTPFGCHSRLSTWGTCVAVAHYGGGTVFLSAGHTFEPDTPQHKVMRITIGGADATLRRYWFHDPAHPRIDFAVLHLAGRQADLMPLAASPPEVGDRVTISGFNFDDTNQPRAIHFHGKLNSRNRGEHGIVDFEFPVGVSGGPVVNQQGQLVGLALHRRNQPRNAGDIGGIQINYDFRKSVLSLFPGSTFNEPALAVRQPAAEPPPKPVPEPKDIPEVAPPPPDEDPPTRQQGSSNEAAGREAESDNSPEREEPDEQTIINRIISNPELLRAVADAAGVEVPAAAPPAGTEETPAASSDWFSTAVKIGATAAFGPAGAAGSSVALGVGGWLWNRRRKRKKAEADEVAAEFNRVIEENDQHYREQNDREREQQEQRRQEAEQKAIEAMQEQAEALQRLGQAGGKAAPETPTEPPADKTAEPDQVAELQQQIAGLVSYLKDRDESADDLPSEGITAEPVVADDGSTTLAYFLDGVRLLKDNRLPVKVLGHREAARAVESYVYERAASADGHHLNQSRKASQ